MKKAKTRDKNKSKLNNNSEKHIIILFIISK